MKSVLIRFGLVLVVLSIVFGYGTSKSWTAAFSKPVDINAEPYPKDYNDIVAVDTELDMIVDIFAEEEITEETDSGAVLSRKYIYYYIVPVFTEDDVFYVGVKVDKEDSKPYDKVADSTWAYLNYETDTLDEKVAFTGRFSEMDEELYEYFEDWFVETEFFESEAEMKEHILPLVLEPMSLGGGKVNLIVSIVMFIAGAAMLFFAFRSGKQAAAATNPIITVGGISYPSSNFNSVNKMVKKGETANAVKELQRLTGAAPEEAASVVSNWRQHWGN